MIFSKDLLFVHVPKTGGMSVTEYLLAALPRPVYYSLPQPDPSLTEPGIVQVPGERHETLEEARELVAKYGFDIARFPMILALIRNPYAIEVSRYAYLQAGHPWDKGHSQQLALTQDFATFAADSGYHARRPLESYFLLDGEPPPNLRIVKFEELEWGVPGALRELGIHPPGAFPHVNQSRHDDIGTYYDKAAEEAVYSKYRWAFDEGYYSRMEPGKPTAPEPTRKTVRLPITGAARQVGQAAGLWPDLWVGRSLRFEVQAQRGPVASLTLEGTFPRQAHAQSELILRIGDLRIEALFDTGRPLCWTVPCVLEPGATARVEVTTTPTWCPRQNSDSKDERQLAFRLSRVVFAAPVECALEPAAAPTPQA